MVSRRHRAAIIARQSRQDQSRQRHRIRRPLQRLWNSSSLGSRFQVGSKQPNGQQKQRTDQRRHQGDSGQDGRRRSECQYSRASSEAVGSRWKGTGCRCLFLFSLTFRFISQHDAITTPCKYRQARSAIIDTLVKQCRRCCCCCCFLFTETIDLHRLHEAHRQHCPLRLLPHLFSRSMHL